MNYDESNQRDSLFERLSVCFLGDPKPDNLPGGRTEALRKLHAYDSASYGRTRNHVDGTVSQLSPYLRHGMLSAVEVKDYLRSKFSNDPSRLEEFLRQLAWRETSLKKC